MLNDKSDNIDPQADTGLPVQDEAERRVNWIVEEVRNKLEPKWKEEGNSKKFIDNFFGMVRRVLIKNLKPELEQKIIEERGHAQDS